MPGCRVLVVHERRLLATGLAGQLDDRPDITEAHALLERSSLPQALTSGWDVVVTSETYALHVLRLVPAGTRVLVIVRSPDIMLIAQLLRAGAAGACTTEDGPDDVGAAVVQVADNEMRLPAHLVQDVLTELQRLRLRASAANATLAMLTARERDVLAALGRGRGRPEIASDLGLSAHTVRTHMQRLLRKLGLHSQLEAAALWRELTAHIAPTVTELVAPIPVIDLADHKARRAPVRGAEQGSALLEGTHP